MTEAAFELVREACLQFVPPFCAPLWLFSGPFSLQRRLPAFARCVFSTESYEAGFKQFAQGPFFRYERPQHSFYLFG